MKYVPPTEEFKGAQNDIDGVAVWSCEPIDAAQADVLRRLIFPRR